jgi:hypothetical protein
VSAFNPNFALTVSGKNNDLSITTYTGDASQSFIILPQGKHYDFVAGDASQSFIILPQKKHYAFVVQSSNSALAVFKDNR